MIKKIRSENKVSEMFKAGDEVFEISNPAIKMRVESVEEGVVVCSVNDLKSFSKRSDTFSQESLKKEPQR